MIHTCIVVHVLNAIADCCAIDRVRRLTMMQLGFMKGAVSNVIPVVRIFLRRFLRFFSSLGGQRGKGLVVALLLNISRKLVDWLCCNL